MHTAYNGPSSLISSPMSEHMSHVPPTSKMDPEVHLRNMGEELVWNQLKTDRIKAALQAILNKSDMSWCGKNIMQYGPSFGIAEPEEMLESDGGKAEEKEGLKLVKVRPATLTDFDRDCGKGCVFFNTCCIYFAIVRDLFPNDQACIHWVLSFSNWIMWPTLQTRYSNTRQRARGTVVIKYNELSFIKKKHKNKRTKNRDQKRPTHNAYTHPDDHLRALVPATNQKKRAYRWRPTGTRTEAT